MKRVDSPGHPSPDPAAGRGILAQIGSAQIAALRKIRVGTSAYMSDAERDELFERAIGLMPDPSRYTGLQTPIEAIAGIGEEVRERFGYASRGAFAVAFVAHLALELLPRLHRMGLTPGILAEYPAAFDRLLAQLEVDQADDYWSGDDLFLKDIRIAGGYSVPCHMVDVDLHSTLKRRSGVKAILRQFDFNGGLRMMLLGGAEWYRLHTDTRNLSNFNLEGQTRGYLLLADLLRLHPEVRGVTRTSWFLDPQLLTISPRLGFLQKQPVENGAFLVCHGTDPIHVQRATVKSRTRRELVASGKYVPKGYSLIWPREALLRWASEQAQAVPG